MNYWWSIGQCDSTAFFIMLANAARLISKRYPFEPKESPEAMTFYTQSIHCLQKRIQTPVDGVSQGVIVSVLEFAYYDVRKLVVSQRDINQSSSFLCRISPGGLSI